MKRILLSVVAWAALSALLALLPDIGYRSLQVPGVRALSVAGALGVIACVLGAVALLRHRLALCIGVLALLTAALLRATFLGLVEFSGRGFAAEFFLHLEPESVVVALRDHTALVASLLGVVAVVALLVALVLARGSLPPRRAALALLLSGLGAVALARDTLPEWQFYSAWREWSAPTPTRVPPELRQAWSASGLLDEALIGKDQVSARLPAAPKNLVLVYVESLGRGIIAPQRWPGLMPNLADLVASHGLVDALDASAFITIEGIANSMCGTLLPFGRDSDSLAAGSRLYARLPCLGDVLARAGYRQRYLGGALGEFAGKGEFLAAHGYEDVRGWEYWLAQGFQQRPDSWGLSDPELFQQATASLRELRAQPGPFNLTLLTIGTHLPGFRYAECTPYGDGSERFLDAVHCTDQLLGRWLQQVRDEGLLGDDTVLVITGDHNVFPSPDMRRLFGEAVDDRRVPLVVIGPTPPLRNPHGASYDLAPTLLDLLAIAHDARFALGRSLFAPAARPAVTVNRYFDVVAGVPTENNPARCDAAALDGAGAGFPLDACGKRILLEALAEQLEPFARPADRIACSLSLPTRFVLPADPAAGLEALMSGIRRPVEFSASGYRVDPAAEGLFVLRVDPDGRVRERRFFAVDALQAPFDLTEHASGALVGWRIGSGPRAALPDWLRQRGLILDADSGLALLDRDGRVVQRDEAGEAGGRRLEIGLDLCRSMFGADDASAAGTTAP